MDPPSHRRRRALLLLGVLMLACGFAGWRWNRAEVRPSQASSSPVEKVAAAMPPKVPAAPQAAGKGESKGPGQTKARTTKKGPTTAQLPVADRYAALPIIDWREDPPDTQPRLRWTLTKLVRDASFKYPLLRIQERWQQGPNGPMRTQQSVMVADHVMVKLKPNVRLEDLLVRFKRLNPELRRRMPAADVWIISFQVPELDTVPKAVEALRRAPDLVEQVDPDYLAHITASPNDTNFTSQWGLHNTGQSGGTADVDIDAPEAWNLNTGSRSVVVGVLDTGTDLVHPDLAANIWTNPSEISGNGIDDDGNGYVDDVHGWDFYNNDNNPQDDQGHGTHVAGTIGAVGNNAAGMSGVCWKVSIATMKFLGSDGRGVTSDAVEAIHYATSIGVIMTSNSWSGGEYETLLQAAITDADTHGALFIAAAGNEGNDNDASARYPSSYTNENLISVAAVNRSGGLASFSSYGVTSVDVGAPGEEIMSTTAGGGYGSMSGTSMAVPHVSGVCALLKAFKPGLSHRDIKSIVLGAAQPLASLAGRCSTGGLLNAKAALDVANDLSVSPADMFAATGEAGYSVVPTTRTYVVTNNGTTSAAWTSTKTEAWLSLSPSSGTLAPGQSINVTVTLQPAVNGLSIGTHNASFTVTSTGTGRTFNRPVSVEITAQYVMNTTLNSAPAGWTLEGQWQYGQPLGLGGGAHGSPDPVAGLTGVNVIGVNLGGDYAPITAGPYYAMTPVLDLTQYQGGKLRFQSWLNADYAPWCSVSAQISVDGGAWTTLYSNESPGQITSTTWTRQEYDISSIADGHGSVRVRFGYQTKEGVYPYSGWNLDDIQILANPVRHLNIALPVASVQEGTGTVMGTVTVSPVPASVLTVYLASSATDQATVSPSSVTFAAGQSTVPFSVNPVNDALLDGSQPVTITASAVNFQPVTTSITVDDNESAQLVVTLPASVMEGASSVTGTVSVPTAVGRAVTVRLSSSDVSEVVVPDSVVIPSGATQVSFPVTVIDDHEIDGAKTAVVSAAVLNWTTGQGTMVVNDNETLALTLELQAGFAEDLGTVSPAGVVLLSGTYSSDLLLTFTSSDPTHLVAPSPVTIPAGETQATVDLTLVNDPAHTGQLAVTVTAQATGFSDGLAVTQVYDLQSVAVASLPSPSHLATQKSPDTNLSWGVAAGGGTVPESYDVYLGTSAVMGISDKVGMTTAKFWALPRLLRGATYFWRIDSHHGADVATGPVWQFTVAPIGGVDHFDWSGVPASTPVQSPITATVTAKDLYGDVVTSFAGSVVLSTQTGAAPVLITEVAPGATGAVELTNVSQTDVNVSGWKVSLYNEWSWPLPSKTVTLGSVTLPAGGVLTLKGGGTAGGSYPTIYVGSAIDWSPTTRMGVMLRTGAGEMIDFVCAGARASQIAVPAAVPAAQWSGSSLAVAGQAEGSYVRTAGEDTQKAADWTVAASSIGSLNAGLLVPFPGTGAAIAIAPSAATFSGGQWTGSLRVTKPHPRTRLAASDGSGHTGQSGLVQITSLGSITLQPIVSSALEGAGTLSTAAVVTLPAPASGDVLLSIVSSDTTEIASGSYTISSGSTVAVIPLTVVNDVILDGSQVVTYEVYAAGYEAASQTFTVHDNETATLSVSTPASASEEGWATPLQGTVTVSAAPGSPVTVELSSSLPAEASVPATVVIPAGATSATFVITVHDDNYVDGTQAALITAHVTNWTNGNATLNVLDDESHALTLDIPWETNESASSIQGTLTLGGVAPQPLNFALTASLPGQLSVPLSVTVSTGQSSAVFFMTPVDDALKDGAVEVEVGVSRATFTSTSAFVLVRDNDANTLTASTIGGTQTEGVLFLWSLQARDINGELLDSVAGPLTLTSTSSTGAVAFAPSTGGPFVRGVWNAQMRVLAPATSVRLTLATPTASVQSNAFTVGMGPRIQVTPPSVSATVFQDLSADRTVTVKNNGAGTLHWAAGSNTSTILSASSIFAGVQSVNNVAPVYTAPTLPALCPQDTAADHAALATVVTNLNASHTAVTGLMPARYDFTEGTSEWYIVSGGLQTFDYGNFLATDRTDLEAEAAPYIPYSDGIVASRSDFGTTGRYVTRKVPGLFMLAADLDNVSTLSISGRLGAAGMGSVDGAIMRATRLGRAWKVMVKRVFNASTPSVNHLVLVPDVTGVNHAFAEDSWVDDHTITGLQRAARLYYLAFTLNSGRYLSNTEAVAVAEKFLDLAEGGGWVRAAPSSGSLTAGAQQTVTVTLDSLNLAVGTSTGGLVVVSDDAVNTPSTVTADITVNASVPTISAEPAFTGGTTNSVTWSSLGSGLEYEAQRASTESFAGAVSSGWTAGTSFSFGGIPHGVQQNYRVRSRLAGQAGWTSRWSTLVTSTQDAQGPVLTFALPSNGFTGQANFVAEGGATDLSPVVSVRFTAASGAQVQAQTADQFAHWNTTLAGLELGSNGFTVAATDSAVPANTTSVAWSITRIDPLAQGESYKLAPVLAAAFNLDASSSPMLAQPRLGMVNDGDDKMYLTVSFRRRIAASGFTYVVETSSDLSNWSSTAGDVIEVDAAPAGDGVTEICTCRITPAISDSPQKFVRVRPVLN